jgi:hypothetical protein
MSFSIISTNQPANLKVQVDVTNANAFDTATLTATAPSTTGQTALAYEVDNRYPSLLKIIPFAFANNYATPGIRVIGWNWYLQSTNVKLWVPTLLADVTLAYNATTGNIPSFANFDGTASTIRFFSSVTVAGGVPTVNLYSPGTGAASTSPPAHFLIDPVGSQYVTIQFKSGTAGTMGAFWYTI